MNVKKLALIGVIALVVVGFVIAAGCTAAPEQKDTESGTMTMSSKTTTVTELDAAGNVISNTSTSSASMTFTTDKFGKVTVSVTDKDPVVGTWVNEKTKIAYVLTGDGKGNIYDVRNDGSLTDPEERTWGKIDGKDGYYIISNPAKDSAVIFTFSSADQTLTNGGGEVFKKRTS